MWIKNDGCPSFANSVSLCTGCSVALVEKEMRVRPLEEAFHCINRLYFIDPAYGNSLRVPSTKRRCVVTITSKWFRLLIVLYRVLADQRFP
jgi:hypothetical protein